MSKYPKCVNCQYHDDDLARIPGHNGCKKRLGVRYAKDGIKYPYAWTCFEPKAVEASVE